MSAPDFTHARWCKSRRSNGEAACVEVAWAKDAFGVRDSKDCGQGTILTMSREAGRTFLEFVKTLKTTSAS